MNKELKIKRLTMLKELMLNHDEHFPTVNFNLSTWFTGDVLEDADIQESIQSGAGCGYAACALGSAACWPPFREMGLKMDESMEPEFGNSMGDPILAGAYFFGISEKQSEHLFFPSQYPHTQSSSITPKEVADRVDILLQKEIKKTCKPGEK